jgi:hypothetical protein
MREDPEHTPRVDPSGRWLPPRSLGGNKLIGGNASGKYWHCTGNSIIPAEGNKLPLGCYHFKTFSVYYDHGTFWSTRGDASTNLIGAGDSNKESGTGHCEDWRCLTFDYDAPTYASHLTNAGEYYRLRTQRLDQDWPRMLLPEHYHALSSSHTEYQQYGGLTGELPLFLALIAFSVDATYVHWALQACFQDESWTTHDLNHVRRYSTSNIL